MFDSLFIILHFAKATLVFTVLRGLAFPYNEWYIWSSSPSGSQTAFFISRKIDAGIEVTVYFTAAHFTLVHPFRK